MKRTHYAALQVQETSVGLRFGLSCVPSSLTSICPFLLQTELLPLTLILLPSHRLQRL